MISLTLSVFREDPLTLYVFSSVAAFKNKGMFHICKGAFEMTDFSLVFDNTRSGSCVANDCVIIAGADGLPFGGTGGSGCTFLFDCLFLPLAYPFCVRWLSHREILFRHVHPFKGVDRLAELVSQNVESLAWNLIFVKGRYPHGRPLSPIHCAYTRSFNLAHHVPFEMF
jgi:hypothetical protein